MNAELRTFFDSLLREMLLRMLYFIMILPAFALAMLAQWMVQNAFKTMSRVPASMTGAEAARRILDAQGLRNIPIEMVDGQLSDHYDPAHKVVRLSRDVYATNSMAAVGIAAHEVGHAIQDARKYAPLVIRNLAVPAASIGGNIGSIFLMIGLSLVMSSMVFLGKIIFLIGIIAFGATVLFQLVNLPVEFDASSRAKTQLIELGIVSGPDLHYVSKVLNAAALTYVAATLQAVMLLAYYGIQFLAATRGDR